MAADERPDLLQLLVLIRPCKLGVASVELL
jgi:hypothetical protein